MLFRVIAILLTVAATASAHPLADGSQPTHWVDAPLEGGPIRAVFVAPYSAHVDTHELMLRFPFEAEVVPVSGPGDVKTLGIPGHYWPDLLKSRRRVIDDLARALETDWEAVVMCGFPKWSEYPDDIREAILRKVASGRALVVPGIGNGLEENAEAQGHSLVRTSSEAEPIGVYRCGEGRIVCFSVSNDNRFGYLLSRSPLQSDFEESAAIAGRVLLRAARPDVPSCVDSVVEESGRVTVRTLEHARATDAVLRTTVRRCDTYAVEQECRLEVTLGSSASIDLPPLAAGDYQVETIATHGETRALDWHVGRFSRVSPVTFEVIAPEEPTVRAGDAVALGLDVKGAPAGLEVSAEWYDAWGRLLLATERREFEPELRLTALEHSLSVLNRVEVTLWSNGIPVARDLCEILMPDQVTDAEFYVLYWNGGLRDTWRARLQADALRRKCAADAFSNTTRSASGGRSAALSKLRVVPYTTAFHGITLGDRLLNKEWLDELEEQARETARGHRPYSPLGHTLGDENYVRAFSEAGRFTDTPAAWALFRAYLQEVYADLAALNAQWGSAFADWQAIRFDSDRHMLTSLENPSAWVDYRVFISRRFCDAHQRMRRAIQEEHPGVWVGFDGAEQYSSYDGYDWWQLSQNMEMVNVYCEYLVQGWLPKLFNGEAVKSFRPDAPLSGCWLNNTDRRYGGRYVTWYLALNGWNSTWWWHATFPHPANGGLTWDLQPTPIVADMAEAARELERGPATLLAHARKQIDPIAVHYSENNWHASTIESGVGNHVNNLGHEQSHWFSNSLSGRYIKPDTDELAEMWGGVTPKGHYAAAAGNVHLLLRDLGYQARTMARQEIEAGELARAGTRVLILPFVVSLSDEEVQAIRSFVEGGGTLIADYRCGLRDLHGRLRPIPALDDVFGIHRESGDVHRARARVTMNYRDRCGAQFETIFHDTITAEGARVDGTHDDGAPALLIHTFGEGTAIYFNCDLYAYDEMRRRGTERDLRELVRDLLVYDADLFAPFLVEHAHGHAVPHTEVTRWQDGVARYYGVLRDFVQDDKAPMEVSLPFPEGGHVYEVRSQRYLGTGAGLDTLEAGQPKMYAALPYKVRGLSVECPKKNHLGRPITVKLRVETSEGQVGPHAVRVEVAFPDGTRPEYLSRTLYLPEGTGTFEFTPALNAPRSGRGGREWALTATEAISGKSATVQFAVR